MLRFDLHVLGWFAFEELCRTICREEWNQPIETYARGPDGGRDGFLYGTWDSGGVSTPAILQCKHVGDPNRHLRHSDLAQEIAKVQRHVEAGQCQRYVLMTNAQVTGAASEQIQAAFSACGVQETILQGYEAICELLTVNKSLRGLVPRLYGLGDLTEILDERHYAQAESILATMHDDLAKLVPVDAHRATYRALRDEHFALLLGRPGSGKSSIAASLAISAMDHFDARPIKLETISELGERWNPRDPNQFFWLDDGFGSTQYEHSYSEAWNRATRSIEAALRNGARLIVTSRDYIFAAARRDLKGSSFPLLDEARVVIEVESFSREEREQILYNHLRLGRQDEEWLRQLKPADLEAAASHDSFLPELARRLADPMFTQDMRVVDRTSLLRFFQRPLELLLEVLVNLDRPSRAALGLVHLRSNHLPSPYVEGPGDAAFLRRVGVTVGEALAALPSLEGSFLRLASARGTRWWQFQHPTFTDVYERWLASEPELLAEYVASADTKDLLRTITCGDVGLEGAIVVPESLYDDVAQRIIDFRPGPLGADAYFWRSQLDNFLARRCDEGFLSRFIQHSPETVRRTFNVGLFLSAHTSERDLARRLLDVGLATEVDRRTLVENLTAYAVEGLDGSFLDDEQWLQFFTAEEIEELDYEVLENIGSLADALDDHLRESGGDVETAEASLRGYEARYPQHEALASARKTIQHVTDYEPDAETIDAWAAKAAEESEVGGVKNESVTAPPEFTWEGRSVFEDLASWDV